MQSTSTLGLVVLAIAAAILFLYTLYRLIRAPNTTKETFIYVGITALLIYLGFLRGNAPRGQDGLMMSAFAFAAISGASIIFANIREWRRAQELQGEG